ncbi:DNA translocase FtsK [Leptotrichia hofstadii]|uniref:FtsK/SpoIIIE family protein n=1 Tax=Leptotrichia hofstadii F0254 TaxID=634994 RepID=C9MYU6_9FUSO|nr:DNA translocase FtsK [Leptotrichia hofstadii]EEX74298.1 FtsK/SpoIIIE family protein [Leptotrichia hofstadii F0254]
MNKRKIEGAIWFFAGLILIMLLANKSSMLSDNVGENIFSLILGGIMLFFGKMTWFIAIIAMLYGIVLFFYEKIRVDITQGKVVALIGVFLSLSMFLVKGSVGKNPLPNVFTEAGRKLLEIGFNRESGGVPGALLSMPFYKILHLKWMTIGLITVLALFVCLLLKDYMELGYELLREVARYYKSDDYKEKKRKLKAKKYAENLKKTDYKRYQREMLKAKIIQSRSEKLSFEIAKKPKDNFLQKTEVYSKEELAEKEKEWIEIFEENEKQKILENAKKTENKEKNDKEEQETETKNTINNEEQEAPEPKKPEEIKEEDKTEKNEEQYEKEPKLEIVTPLRRETAVNSAQMDPNFQQFPKLEAFENSVAVEKGLEEELKEANAMLDSSQGYDDVVKKSIAEIFKSKPMDYKKKEKIEKSIRENVRHLENVLKEFGVEAKVVNYEYGPTITRYEIIIPKGIKVSKVTGLSDDIAMNLAAESIRIEAPIPGKNTIGIETPNKIKEPVHFSNIIKNKELDNGELRVILGKDIVGRDKLIDIVKMPHLLIAGQTGSGKSVAVNTLISTLISKKSENEVKFIMIDPKMVELMPYNDIPHLLVPVIIDPQQAAIALKWAVNEMENRYRKLMENGVRNIKKYNNLSYVEKMPYIVIIIDELADLMMVAAGSVEESIARIAQKARAVGIHLVVATQRPSTDVITGMIKANLPSRISFALRSQIDSRTILDTAGAEKLLGQGDMLLLANGSSKLERIQGAYISDDEVKNLTDTLKSARKVKYRNEILEETQEEMIDVDPFFENAINIIRQENKVSISLLQRKLKVGFNRASRIYEQLKEHGVISFDDQILVDNIDEIN